MSNIFSISNKKVLVTGGMGGIGISIVKGLVDAGARVSVFGRKKNKRSFKEINFFKVDLTCEEGVNKCFKEFIKINGGIDILVNIAGITIEGHSKDYLKENWQKTIDINLSATFYLIQKVANEMISRKIKGSIINITSISAMSGFPNNPAYVASKGGLNQLTKALACDFGIYGIRVNNIVPGYIKTKMTEKSWNNLLEREKRRDNTILGRWGKPDDLVGPVIFLASEGSRYITGQDICVDGGWTAKGI